MFRNSKSKHSTKLNNNTAQASYIIISAIVLEAKLNTGHSEKYNKESYIANLNIPEHSLNGLGAEWLAKTVPKELLISN